MMTFSARKAETFTVAVLAPPDSEHLTFYIYNKRLKFAQKIQLAKTEFAEQVKTLQVSVEDHLQALASSLTGSADQGFDWPGAAKEKEARANLVHSGARPKLGYVDPYELMDDQL